MTRLSADDVVDLKKAGLSDGLLTSLLGLAEPPPAAPAPVSKAMAKLLSDPSVVYDGRYFYPRSYFSSDHTAYSSAGIGIQVATPYVGSWPADYRFGGWSGWHHSRGYSVRTSACGWSRPRACYR